ncbi:hypothetical protein [Flavihumibacter fluvii]|uniref:hypothetical protein n=1 Tax=Flavihumibacter fluvii TaxID=2838157 RepID=UPI001BDF1E13|nr:hypothetical protein [Flavihumibacter fluvii]ULQ51710.1 hypothetical protein KJS93_16605 [Flavihumibacter fluvii]
MQTVFVKWRDNIYKVDYKGEGGNYNGTITREDLIPFSFVVHDIETYDLSFSSPGIHYELQSRIIRAILDWDNPIPETKRKQETYSQFFEAWFRGFK